MQIRNSTYFVRDKRCPCDCDGNGQLMYIACPGCGKILLVCTEIGNVFDNLSDPLQSDEPLVIWRISNQVCPGCRQEKLSDFIAATEEQLQAIGLKISDYEIGDSSSIEYLKGC